MMRLLKALLAATALAGLILGPPWLLVRFVGNPWPEGGVSLSAPMTDTALIGLLATVVWVLWGQLVVCILVEAVAALTDDRVQFRAPLTLGVQQQLARSLVSAVVMVTISTPVAVGDGAAMAAGHDVHPGHPGWAGHTNVSTAHTAATGQETVQRAGTDSSRTAHQATQQETRQDHPQQGRGPRVGATVTVMRLDSLWSIAERVLGDGDRWTEIAALNEGQVMADGTRFTSADHIKPGWQLRVPADAATRPTGTPDGHQPGREHQVVVETGDTLSEIAQEELGDPEAYPRIFEASKMTTQPGGAHLTDPDVIDTGWTLTIPGAPTPGQQPGHQPDTRPGSRQDSHQDKGGAKGGHRGPHAGPDADASPNQAPGPALPGRPETGGPGTAEATPQPDSNAGVEAGQEPAPDTPGVGAATAEAAGGAGTDLQRPWLLAGLTGGGAVLAGGLLLGLRARRRAQSRNRRPGRAIASPDEALAAVEKSISVSTHAAATVQDLDAALRRLAAWSATAAEPMPAVAAVELTAGPEARLVLHLAAPAPLPYPWHDEQADGLHWACDPTEAQQTNLQTDTQTGGQADEQVALDAVDAPYPLLVTVGSTPAGDVWLLNCEELAAVRVTGDSTRGRDFARYLVAELAMNPWSQQAHVDCVGIGAEVVPMNPDRIEYHPVDDPEAVAETLGAALADAVRTVDRANQAGGTVTTGRTGQLGQDTWPARVLVLERHTPTGPDSGAARRETGAGSAGELSELVRGQAGRTATAVLLLDEDGDDTTRTTGTNATAGAGEDLAVELRIGADGRLELAIAGLELDAVGLSVEEAQGCAALLAQADEAGDTEVPIDLAATQGWASYADEAGALRREHTIDRGVSTEELSEPAGSVLPAPGEDYVREAAATEEDLAALAPQVPTRLRGEVEDADPRLDADLADWFDERCRRPRLLLLGPVTAHAYGKPLVKQRAYMTELLAYLALRRRTGATPGEVATAFGITLGKTREYVRVLRNWLGENPRTGQPYLPHADKSPASTARGVSVYQIDQDVLVDADLFRRLRVRGEARGAEGIEDLRRALLLVTGRPFDQLREAGWAWLIDGDRLDHHMAPAVADVAFLVATHSLQRHELSHARAAAEIGALAAPDEEAARLCLARVCEAEGNGSEAERILRDEVCNRADNDQAPADLSERTAQIIRNHRWLGTGSDDPAARPPTQPRDRDLEEDRPADQRRGATAAS